MTGDRLVQGSRRAEPVDTDREPGALPAPTILTMCDRLLDEVGRRRHMFAWLRAPGASAGEWLAVDAYYPRARLVLICRSARGPHDALFQEQIPAHGLDLVMLDPTALGDEPAAVEAAVARRISAVEHGPRPTRHDSQPARIGRRDPQPGPARIGRRAPQFALSVAVGVAAGFLLSRWNLDLRGLVMLAIVLTAALPIAFRMFAGRFDPFEPIFVFALAWIAQFVVRPAAMLSEHNFLWSQAGHDIDVRSTFSRALVLGLFGAIGFVVGYALPAGRRLAERTRRAAVDVDNSWLVAVATVCLLIGVAMFGAFIVYLGGVGPALHLLSTGRSQSLTAVFQTTPKYLYFGISLLAPAALMFLAVGFGTRRRLLIAAGTAALIPYLIFAYPTGDRTLLLPLVGGLVFYCYLARSKRPGPLTLALLLAVALFGSSYLLHVRTKSELGSGSQEGGDVPELISHPGRIFDPLTKGADASEFPALAGALLVIPSQLHYEYGRALVTDLLTRPIPRALWHAKPRPPREQVIANLFPTEYAAGRTGLVNPEFTVLLIFFLDFGVIGCLLGMVCYGILARFLYAYFVLNERTLEARLVLAIGVPLLVEALRDSPVDGLSHYVVFLGPVLLACFAPRARRATARASAETPRLELSSEGASSQA